MNKKLEWCFKQTKGIELIEEKEHLSEAYMKEAKETLENVHLTKGKWKIITAYYACYNGIYSILMKIGVKSEIHECTIELMEEIGFEKEEIEFIKELKEKRIQNQYYLKNIELENEEKVTEFVQKCEEKLSELNDNEKERIKNKIKTKKQNI